MSTYQYNPTPPDPPESKGQDTLYWIITWVLAILFLPVGVMMAVIKLMEKNNNVKKESASQTPPSYIYVPSKRKKNPWGAKTTAHQEETSSSWDRVASLLSKSKGILTLGAVISVIALCSLWFDAFISFPLFAVGLGHLALGETLKHRAALFRTYLSAVGPNTVVSLSSLSAALHRTPKQVERDLQQMLDQEIFPAGYLDHRRNQLVLSGEGVIPSEEFTPPQATASAPGEPDPIQQQEKILQEIRHLAQKINHDKLSQQVNRIGMLTSNIFEYEASHPDQASKLHSFLNYYLPTTLKILRSYTKLAAQEVSGDNITGAMERIEEMMDKIVEGFETKLDQLFQGEVLEITSDIEVMERMLQKDGLSSNDGLFPSPEL